jgi:hypothetical protein
MCGNSHKNVLSLWSIGTPQTINKAIKANFRTITRFP